MDFLTQAQWSPYAVGVGIGVLSWITFLVSDKPIACSTTFAKSSGMLEKLFRGKKVAEKPYYQKINLTIDWQFMLVIGIVIGSFISATLSESFQLIWVPDIWADIYGPSPFLRTGVAILGGIFLGFGARWADGCTSGHGISGTMQLTLSSWVSAISFFVGGIAMAHLLFRLSV
ncbi:YeeE/YedE thiosulfate transporter family protein [Tindallia californiensis]|uniref:Uncharacterized protein n=1 Tax=Tindallia californiensis TaxID=159292 RepID=A0A1H3M874_9FIRM|nr:YeeE/YedE thiosulfate transporter family protein [Tindallia californiensis]SDY72776.1 hypothetical protein SAMN05192546_10431 [Tindallia californiensis]